MRVDELRKLLSKYDANTLKEIAVTLYKQVPKSRKEDSGLDELLSEFSLDKPKPSVKTAVDFNTLRDEIRQFFVFANEQYYFAPNRYVRKEQRSKWRFEVRRFIKGLLTVGGENTVASARLLAEVYAMLCYACNYYIFSTENPFSAVGYSQPELLDITLGRIFYSGYDSQSVKNAVFVTLDSTVDRETLNVELMFVLIKALKTPETKEMALPLCVDYMNGYADYQAEKKVFKYPTGRDSYRTEEHINYAIELYLLLCMRLFEYDRGIKFFWKHYKGRDEEVRLYILLKYLGFGEDDDAELNGFWLREYEKAIKRRVKPRDYLQKEYDERKARVPENKG